MDHQSKPKSVIRHSPHIEVAQIAFTTPTSMITTTTTTAARVPFSPPPLPLPLPLPLPPPPPPRASKLGKILCCCGALAIVLLIILFATLAVLQALFRPEFQLNSVSSLSPLNVSTSHLTACWDVVFTVINTSKKLRVKYTRLNAVIFYHNVALEVASIPSFSQGTRNETTLGATLSATWSQGDDWCLANDLSRDSARGEVSVDIVLFTLVSLGPGAWWSWWVGGLQYNAFCLDVKFANSSSGGDWTMVGGTRSCDASW